MVALSSSSPWSIVDEFIDDRGLIVQCCHCRRLRRPRPPHTWIKVPALPEPPHPRTSHGLCEACLERFYPPIK